MSRRGPSLLEIGGLVLGYSLAALAARSVAPQLGSAGWAWNLAALLAFAWAGLTMAGPFVLALRRDPLTRAELAWAGIGLYGITLASGWALVGRAPPPWSGLLPLIALVGLRMMARKHDAPRRTHWTHPAALVVLMTWPPTWLLIVGLARGLKP